MRADARKNRDHLLAVAAGAIAEQGVEVSLRDIARRADVGLATLLRHFPSREALLDALLRTSFEGMTAKAGSWRRRPRPRTPSSRGCGTAWRGRRSTGARPC